MVEMTEFSKRLFKQIELSGKAVNQVERELGLPRNALQNYKKGREPSGSRLMLLAAYFDISPEYLMGQIGLEPVVVSVKYFFNKLEPSQKRELVKICHQWMLAQIEND